TDMKKEVKTIMKHELLPGLRLVFRYPKELAVVLLPLSLFVALNACAEIDYSTQNTPLFVKAREAVNGVIKSQFSYDRTAFAEKISEDFSDRMEFLFDVEVRSMQKMPVDFEFFIDAVNEAEDVLSVLFSWNRQYMNWDDPDDTTAKGKSEFVFQKTAQGFLLKNIAGDNPF
ncbi:MAG: hypothetical protein PHQ54_04745, partial [Candidatus Omnitrophica bacterium]|nr:hypothetical protein [Candidatus Omnitrophota bacterium]